MKPTDTKNPRKPRVGARPVISNELTSPECDIPALAFDGTIGGSYFQKEKDSITQSSSLAPQRKLADGQNLNNNNITSDFQQPLTPQKKSASVSSNNSSLSDYIPSSEGSQSYSAEPTLKITITSPGGNQGTSTMVSGQGAVESEAEGIEVKATQPTPDTPKARGTPKKSKARKKANKKKTKAAAAQNKPLEAITDAATPKPLAQATRPVSTESPYARKYPEKSEGPVIESMLPRFTMPPKTIDPEIIIENVKKRAKELEKARDLENAAKAQTTVIDDDEELYAPGKTASSQANKKGKGSRRRRRRISSASDEGDGAVQDQKRLSIAVGRSRSQQQSSQSIEGLPSSSVPFEHSDEELTISSDDDPSTQNASSQRTFSSTLPFHLHDDPDYHQSTFFYPHHDYPHHELPQWHTEKPIHHPPKSEKEKGSSSSASSKPNPAYPWASEDERLIELAQLLEPMTEDEDETAKVENPPTTESAEEGDLKSSVTFPVGTQPRTMEEYAVLMQGVRERLMERDLMYGRLEQCPEEGREMIKAHEKFEKKEGWGDRTNTSRPAATKSRASGTADVPPDWLEWMRTKLRDE